MIAIDKGKGMKIRQFFVAAIAAATPVVAFATDDVFTVPEPATLALLGVGAIALIVVARANKRK